MVIYDLWLHLHKSFTEIMQCHCAVIYWNLQLPALALGLFSPVGLLCSQYLLVFGNVLFGMIS